MAQVAHVPGPAWPRLARMTRRHAMPVLSSLAPGLAVRWLYFVHHGRLPDLKQPRLFSEHMARTKLPPVDPRHVRCADKLAVRDFVKERGREETLVPLHRVYERVEEIDWTRLPSRFVMRCSHGSKAVILCPDRRSFDADAWKGLLERWMAAGTERSLGEVHYRDIPRRILLEDMLDSWDGGPLVDHKFWCFHGRPRFVLLVRGSGMGRRFYSYRDLDWKPLQPHRRLHPEDGLARPPHFDALVELAATLSAGFSFVRVDLYDTAQGPRFGEMTFTPWGGVGSFFSDDWDARMGAWIAAGARRRAMAEGRSPRARAKRARTRW